MKLFKTKYRLVKICSSFVVKYSTQKKVWIFPWKEVDYEYSEESGINTFNKYTTKPKIEILKEVTV